MSLWGRVFAAGYDTVMKGPEQATFRGHRAALLGQVSGRVLEIGGGTGANLDFYPAAGVTEIVITEPEEPMAKRLERKLSGHSLPVRIGHAPPEALPAQGGSFASAVSTPRPCPGADPAPALPA